MNEGATKKRAHRSVLSFLVTRTGRRRAHKVSTGDGAAIVRTQFRALRARSGFVRLAHQQNKRTLARSVLSYGNLLRGVKFVHYVPCIPQKAYYSALRKIPPQAVCEPRHMTFFPFYCFVMARFVFTAGRKNKRTLARSVLLFW